MRLHSALVHHEATPGAGGLLHSLHPSRELPRTGSDAMTLPMTDHPLAYKNEQFIDSEAARPLRILAEYLSPLEAFRRERIKDTIVFFGSARIAEDGPLGRYYDEARELARLVTQ